jgi:hypothetical protein
MSARSGCDSAPQPTADEVPTVRPVEADRHEAALHRRTDGFNAATRDRRERCTSRRAGVFVSDFENVDDVNPPIAL